MIVRPVFQRHDKLIIVAGGTSLSGFDLSKLENLPGIKTISVNGSFNCFNSDYFCTIDPCTKFILDILATKSPCYKYVGFKKYVGNCHLLKRYVIKEGDSSKEANSLLCEDKREIQSHNSAFAAFNLAYHMEPKKVLLLGVDANNEAHFYDNITYPEESKGWKISISKIPNLFEYSLPQIKKRGIEVINGSLVSNIQCFPKLSIEEGLSWIQQ